MRLPKVTTRRLLMAIAAIGLTLGGIRFLHYVYYEDRYRVRAQLDRVRGISDIEVNGWDDITYEVSSTRFKIAGRPDTLIVIQQPQDGLLGDAQHLWLEQLGPWQFQFVTYGYHGVIETESGKPVESLSYRNSIDIGPLGEFGAMLPVEVRDVNDLVSHYDELVRYFATWPDEKRWGRLDKPSGHRKAYCRMTTPGIRPIPPPAQFPGTW